MKKILILFVAAAMLCSCEGWLDVTPGADTKQEHLFRNEAGFRSALLGVYIDLGEQSLYGGNLTLGFSDVLAQYYTVAMGNPFYEAARYDYGSAAVEAKIADVWSWGYNAIANLNNLLDQIEKKGPGFFGDPRYYGILKGEAIALRAMIHFDMLRLVGPSPVTRRDTRAIPFVNRVSKVAFESLTVGEMVERCLAELEEASELLREVDPVSPYYRAEYPGQGASVGEPDAEVYSNDSRFLLDRGLRLNWVAVRALMARVALYGGDSEMAGELAGECLASGKFTAADDLFTLHVDALRFFADTYLNVVSTTRLDGLIMTAANRDYFYETAQYGSDSRPMEWFASPDQGILVMRRFSTRPNQEDDYPQHMPMIDGAEVYLIYAECAASEQERYRAINDERRAFNIMGSDELTPGGNPDLEAEIAKEYRKKFIGEGQMFYYMKRKNMTSVVRANNEVIRIDPASVYTMMENLPQDEYDYGKINQ